MRSWFAGCDESTQLTFYMCNIRLAASLIQKRLSFFFDDRIRSTQFGFRANRSTTQPIHIMRRILEVFERQQNSFHVLFLDWSNAFDSVTFPAIESALHHMGVPLAFVKNNFVPFIVRDAGNASEISSQTRGLRQGCPLSPYLFNFVLSHLFHDVEESYISRFGLLSGVINTPRTRMTPPSCQTRRNKSLDSSTPPPTSKRSLH